MSQEPPWERRGERKPTKPLASALTLDMSEARVWRVAGTIE